MTLAIVFDLDDTLYPERSYNLSGFSAVGAYVLGHHGIDGFGQACVELYQSGARGDIFDQASQRLGVALPMEALVAAYRDHAPHIDLFDDARDALRKLKGRHPLGLLTDGYAGVQRRKIAALGIEPLFDSIVVSDELGRDAWKPSPKPYERTMAQLAGQADRFVYIADNPAKDFVTARALGWDTVMVKRPTAVHRAEPQPGHEADKLVMDMNDIPWERLGEHR